LARLQCLLIVAAFVGFPLGAQPASPAQPPKVTGRGLEHPPEQPSPSLPPGKTYALLIGVSHYQNDPPITSLQFADKDAQTFAEFLKTPLGGGLNDTEDIRLLVNEKATRAAVDDAVKELSSRPGGPSNTLILFVAAHGVYLTEEEDPDTHKKIERDPYVLLYGTNTQDPKTTGYSMEELRRTVAELAGRFGRVLVFLDVCHAANVAGIGGGSEVQEAVKKAWQRQTGEFGLMMASHAGESAIESSSFGGGHGAFSYFLLTGLNGPAAFPGDTEITFGDLAQFVRDNVRRFTRKAQDPFDEAPDTSMVIIPDTKKPGMSLPPAQPLSDQDLRDMRHHRGVNAPKIFQVSAEQPSLSAFEAAVARGALLPEDENSAATLIDSLRRNATASPDAIQSLERRLKIAMEDRGDEVMSRYLEGEEVAQSKSEFTRCARLFAEAARISQDPAFDQSRAQFCEARALIFDGQYDAAEKLLNQSIAIDPRRAYSYNALGIADLERIAKGGQNFDDAERAFRTAMRFAPYWVYPAHNLALLLSERGDYDEAIRTYEYAMSIGPRYSYPAYNLGLLYERLGDYGNARRLFEKAQERVEQFGRARDNRWPERARVRNALGTILRAEGKLSKAETLFRQALSDDPDDPNAAHNLALLLAKRGDFDEADRTWQANIQRNPQFLASRTAFAASLEQRGQIAMALSEYQTIVSMAPDYVGARESLARLYLRQKDPQSAIIQIDAALAQSGLRESFLELRGDAHAQLGNLDSAKADWANALKLAADRVDRARVSRKLRS
jgi:tetratricopeptide (TPR) repeat protein